MSQKQYDEDDIERLAKLIGKQFEDKFDAYIEVSDTQNKVFLESFDAILDEKLDPIRQDVGELKTNMKVVATVVTDTNNDLHKLGKRTARLEAAHA